MKFIQTQRRTTSPAAVPLDAYFREHIHIERDPSDPAYQQRYAADMIDGFRALTLLVFATNSLLFLVHIVRMDVGAVSPHALSALACAALAFTGGVGLVASKSIRSPALALLATAALLVASVAVLTVDRLRHERTTPSPPIAIVFPVLMLSAAVLPLAPSSALGLGVLLLASCGLAARFTGAPFQLDSFDFVSAGTVLAVSVVIAARSRSLRIRIQRAHTSVVEAEHQAEAARARALLSESAITMEHLAASLCHELNTPIGVLKSATETLTRGVQRHASFPKGSSLPQMIEELSNAIRESAARLSETVARIQRFANLDHSAVRLVDINQLVRDAVALMNPPSVNQMRLKLTFRPLPNVWCRPRGVSVAIAYILNTVLECTVPATIDTYSEGADVVVKVVCPSAPSESQDEADLSFAIVNGRVRASAWDLFAARQLVRENGGDLRVERLGARAQVVTIHLPVNAVLAGQDVRGATTVMA